MPVAQTICVHPMRLVLAEIAILCLFSGIAGTALVLAALANGGFAPAKQADTIPIVNALRQG